MVATAVPVFDIGDVVFFGNHSSISGTTAFKNTSGVDTDPTEVELRVKHPDATVEVYRWPTPGIGEFALSHETMGRFYAAKTLEADGPYGWKLTGAGTVGEAAQGRLYVRPDAA